MDSDTKPFIPKKLLSTIEKKDEKKNIFVKENKRKFVYLTNINKKVIDNDILKMECERVSSFPMYFPPSYLS